MSEFTGKGRSKLRVLTAHKSNLESFLEDIDEMKLSMELIKSRVITREVKDKFASLDPDHVVSDIKVRYLFHQMYERVREDEKVYDRLVRVLSKFGGDVKGVCEAMKKELDEEKGDENSYRVEGNITEEDVPFLTEILVTGSHKWESIGIALKLPKYILVNCNRGDDNVVKLNNILTAWVSGSYEGKGPATLECLRTALASQTAQLKVLALKVDNINMSKGGLLMKEQANRSCVPEIEYQSYDTEVSEGKSTLLEVQVSCNGYESYQWSKDGQPLLDGADYSGVSSSILYINRASQGTEGKYSCTVSNGRETVCSDDINLKVLYSPEKKDLVELYSLIEKKIPKDSWPPVGNSKFINLVLIKQSPISKCDYYTIRGDMDDILESKKEVTYDEVFSEYREGELVLVEGRPGSGKTTLVHKVTRDWVKGITVQGAKMVFLITLRILNFTGKDTSLSDLLQIFYDSVTLKARVITGLEECRGKGVCFILDGLDEYQQRNKEESVIHQLIHKKCFPFSMVIVASRPVATDKLKVDCDRRIEVVGFTKSQIYKYVETYPFTSLDIGADIVSSLKTYLRQHPNALHMCYLPVHAAMICFLFSELGDNIPHTETQIYEQFTIATLLRQRTRSGETKALKSLKDLCGKEKKDFHKICELAYRMTSNSEQVVSESDFSMSLSDVTSSVVGLLTVEQASRYYGVDHLYTFHHLTFQEYLAAVHIVGLEEDKQRNYEECDSDESSDDTSCSGGSNLKNVIKFCFGLLGAEKSLLLEDKTFVEQLFRQCQGYRNRIYNIQCAFESQHVGLCNYCINEDTLKFNNIVLTASDFVALGYVVSTASHTVSKLSLGCSWDYEGVMAFSSTPTKRLQTIKTLKLSCVDSSDWPKAWNGLLLQLPDLEELHFSWALLSKLNVECCSENVKLLNLRVLKICLPMVPCSHPEETLKLLTFGSYNIRAVYCDVRWDGVDYFALWKKRLCYAFGFQMFEDSDISWVWLYNSNTFSSLCPERFSYCTEVVLVNCGIDDEVAELLASRINSSVLENIVLDFNRICDSGAVALAGCMSRCSVLQEVCMECNSIGDSGATALASALVNCGSLRRLDLQGNAISDEGAVALAKGAGDKPHLDLYLHNVNITEEGVKKVLELRARTQIRRMDFNSSCEAISEAAIDDLRRALTCGSLPALKISDTNINNINILVQELEQVRNVKHIQCDRAVTNDILPTLCDIISLMNSLEHLQCYLCDPISSGNAQLFSDILRSCDHLHSLSLQYSCTSDLSVITAAVVECCSNVRSLKLCKCSLGLDGVTQLFSCHKSWFNLHTLNLNGNSIDSDGVQILSKVLAHCSNLCYLDLSCNHIDDRGCLYLAEGLQHHTSLLGLNLGLNLKITSEGVASFIPVIRNNHLQELDLSLNKIGSKGVTAIMEVICTDTLQTLKLRNIGMGLEGVVALSSRLKKCRQLVKLDIYDNNIGSHGMSFLAEGLQYCTNLQVLNLHSNFVASDNVVAIVSVMKTCKYLKELDIGGYFISVDDITDLVVGWQCKNMLTLTVFPDDPHRSALHKGKNCCSSCDHLLEVYNNNDHIVILDIPKLISSK